MIMDEEEFELRNEVQFWAGRLFGFDQQYEAAKEIVETIKHATNLTGNTNNGLPVDLSTGELEEWRGMWYKCPKCDSHSLRFRPNYCSECGQSLLYQSACENPDLK